MTTVVTKTGSTESDTHAEKTAISVRNFSFYYGTNKVLHDISLSIPDHQVTALIGPSGCGKSTFLRSINRMNDLVPGARAEGEILVGETSVNQPGTDIVALRRTVGMVFQRSNPFPKSIADNITYGPKLGGITDRLELERIVEETLTQVGLWSEVRDRLQSSALALSGGQQQRLCIARAIAVQPEILLMDEPASALDPIATRRIEELILELKNRYTIVIVTHNMQQAARISDRTAFFYMGEVVEYDTTRVIFTTPRQSRTEDYVTGRFG